MFLYLVRHGSTVPDEIDPDRPLSELGKAEAQKTAEILAQEKQVGVDRIIHSGKIRARQTAEIIAEMLEPSQGIMESDGLFPNDPPAVWGRRIQDIRDNVMLVGHLPFMPNLSSLLLANSGDDSHVEFQPATALGLKRENKRWKKLWQVIPR
jgi:phosphohistidine phosphatase